MREGCWAAKVQVHAAIVTLWKGLPRLRDRRDCMLLQFARVLLGGQSAAAWQPCERGSSLAQVHCAAAAA